MITLSTTLTHHHILVSILFSCPQYWTYFDRLKNNNTTLEIMIVGNINISTPSFLKNYDISHYLCIFISPFYHSPYIFSNKAALTLNSNLLGVTIRFTKLCIYTYSRNDHFLVFGAYLMYSECRLNSDIFFTLFSLINE